MKKTLKLLSVIMTAVFLFCVVAPSAILAENDGDIDFYADALYSLRLTISSSGLSRTTWDYSTEIPNVTHGRVTVHLEKRSGFLGLGWSTVEVGNALNAWVYNLSTYPPAGGVTKEFQLTESGTYRAVAVFLLVSNGEEITKTIKSSTVKYSG